MSEYTEAQLGIRVIRHDDGEVSFHDAEGQPVPAGRAAWVLSDREFPDDLRASAMRALNISEGVTEFADDVSYDVRACVSGVRMSLHADTASLEIDDTHEVPIITFYRDGNGLTVHYRANSLVPACLELLRSITDIDDVPFDISATVREAYRMLDEWQKSHSN